MDTEHALTIFVAREGDAYVAQCIEYDIRAQAQDMDTLFTRMTGLLKFECQEGLQRTGRPFGDLGPAPVFYADMAARIPTRLKAEDGTEYRFAA